MIKRLITLVVIGGCQLLWTAGASAVLSDSKTKKISTDTVADQTNKALDVRADSSILQSGTGKEKLYINTGFKVPVSRILDHLTANVFNRLGIAIKFQLLPAERSLKLVNSGIDDIECCRIAKVIEQSYPELIVVPEPLYKVTFSAFATNPEIKIKSWTDLKPFSVGAVRGYKLAVMKAKEVEPTQLTVLDTPSSLFHMLDKKRIDVGLISYEDGLEIIHKNHYTHIHAIEPPLAQLPLHLVLNKKHKAMVPELNRVIKQMREEGVIDKISADVLKHYQ